MIDLISRQSVAAWLTHMGRHKLAEMIMDKRRFPPETKEGKWLGEEEIPNSSYYIVHNTKFCSVCHNEAYHDSQYGQQLFDFCPYCGADMRTHYK